MEELKKIAGVTAAKYVEDGMVVGLGTGSTAYFFVEEIGRRIKEEGLSVVGVTTSSQTTKQAEGLGIPLKAVDDIDSIDVTVDGRSEKIGYKIREARLDKLPYMLVVGQQEEADGTVSVRSRFAGDEGIKKLDEFIDAICKEIRTKEIRKEIPLEERK
mgnify:CR=1 FL=1